MSDCCIHTRFMTYENTSVLFWGLTLSQSNYVLPIVPSLSYNWPDSNRNYNAVAKFQAMHK